MPGKLPASASLLDAIFAHTNRLEWADRQLILRFLAGTDTSPPPADIHNPYTSRSSSLGLGDLTEFRADNSGENVENMMVETSGTAEDRAPPPTSTSNNSLSNILNTVGAQQRRTVIRTNRNGDVSRRIVETGRPEQTFSSNIRQILLHEERRTEQRPVNHANREDSSVPTSILSTNEAPNGMKTYVIVDQIIFEMDYSSGCWKKLRRKIRMADKSHLNTNSSVPSSSSGNLGRPESDTLNIDPVVSINQRRQPIPATQTPVSNNPTAASDTMTANNRAAAFLRTRNLPNSMRPMGMRDNQMQPPSSVVNDQQPNNRAPRYTFNGNGPATSIRGTMFGSARTRQLSSSSGPFTGDEMYDLVPPTGSTPASMTLSGR